MRVIRRIIMSIFDTVKGTVSTAVDTISSVAQTLVDKNRTNAKLNRLRLVMKTESELMNRAYIALGKQFYEAQKRGEAVAQENQEKLFDVIERSKSKIARARDCYRKIVDSQNDVFYGKLEESAKDYSTEEVVDITVACSNESDYKSSPFETAETESKTADEVKEETVENSEEIKQDELQSEEPAEEIEDTESPNGELF